MSSSKQEQVMGFMGFMEDALNTLDKMYEYQKKNDIKRQCITNAQYFRDYLFYSGIPVKTAPMFVLFEENGVHMGVGVHMVVVWKDALLDPSYEYASKNAKYFATYKELLSHVNSQNPDGLDDKENCKIILKEFLEFVDFAKKQNQGEIMVGSKEYYYAQANYVEGKH